jgi:hypothetical protein
MRGPYGAPRTPTRSKEVVVRTIDPSIGTHEFEPSPGAALVDLDTLVAEVGASFPLLAYTASVEDEDVKAEAMDSMILAGLVSP